MKQDKAKLVDSIEPKVTAEQDRFGNIVDRFRSVTVDGTEYYVRTHNKYGDTVEWEIGTEVTADPYIPHPERLEDSDEDELAFWLEETLIQSITESAPVFDASRNEHGISLILAHWDGWADDELDAMGRAVTGRISISGDVGEEAAELIKEAL